MLPYVFWRLGWAGRPPVAFFLPQGLILMYLGLEYLVMYLGICSDNKLVVLTRRELVTYYSQRSGWRADNFDFYEVFGLSRLMVIIQQIYRRFMLGQTTNPQFSGFGQAAAYLGKRCRRLIEGSNL